MRLADGFIQSDLQGIQAIYFFPVYVFPWNQAHNHAMHYHLTTRTVYYYYSKMLTENVFVL